MTHFCVFSYSTSHVQCSYKSTNCSFFLLQISMYTATFFCVKNFGTEPTRSHLYLNKHHAEHVNIFYHLLFSFFSILGICLFLVKDRSEVDSYDCQHFVQSCPTGFYTGSTVYKCKCTLLSKAI